MSDEKVTYVFQVVGGILGILAFLWNLVGYIWTYILSHLQIDISIEKLQIENKEKLKVMTTVENTGSIAKRINYAFLLISPDSESLQSALKQIINEIELSSEKNNLSNLLQHCIQKGNHMNGLVINKSCAIYNLPFFYEEQFQIGNEKVKYSYIIDLAGFKQNKAYNIRFITISKHLFNTYLRHRSTSDLFIY